MMIVRWTVLFQDDFFEEFQALSEPVQTELFAMVEHLERFGPTARRPQVDTLKGAKLANLKEFRFNAGGGVWRVAFAFDPKRRAIVLAAGDKSGVASAAFYRSLIALAEKRMAKFMAVQKEAETKTKK